MQRLTGTITGRADRGADSRAGRGSRWWFVGAMTGPLDRAFAPPFTLAFALPFALPFAPPFALGLALAFVVGHGGVVRADDDFVPRFASADATIELADAVLSPRERQFVATHPVLRVAIQRSSFPPYWRVAPDGEIGGYAVEMLQTIASAVGFELEPVVYDTWPEVLDALRERRADVIPAASYSTERSAYLDYTPGLFPDPVGLIGRAGDDRFDDNRELAGVRVAVARAATTEQQLRLLYPEATGVPVGSVGEALEQLANGSVDLLFGSVVSTLTTAEEERGDSSLRVVRRAYAGTGWSHIVSRSDWPLVGQMFGRFVGSGRDAAVEVFAGTLGGVSPEAFATLPLTEDEVALLGSHETLRLGALAYLPTLNGATAGGTHTGIASGYAAHVAHEFGLPTEVVRYATVADMLDGAAAGEIDLVPLLPPDPALRDRLAFSSPYLETPWLLLGREDAPRNPDLDRLAGGRLGLRDDHPLKTRIEERHPDIEIVEYARGRDLLQALMRRDIDAGVLARLLALPLLSQSFDGEVHVLGELDGPPATFAFAAPPATADLIPLVDRVLTGMDPLLGEQIVRRWTAIDFEGSAELRRRLAILLAIAVGLGAVVLAVGWWNRRISAENRRRVIAEQRLIDMTAGLRTGVFQLRQEGTELPRFVFSNPVAKRMARLGDERSGIDSHVGFIAHVHPEDRSRVGRRMTESLLGGEAFDETFRFTFPDGEEGWVLADAIPRSEPDGTRLWNGYLFDLTAERRLSENLSSLLAIKEEFVAAAGHELRAPVQNLSLALEALGTTRLDAEQERRLRTAVGNVEDLRALIDDLLDIGRLDAHALALREVPVRLAELFELAAAALETSIARKGLAFDCHVASSLPAFARLDPVRLRQILHNLVGNAIKYTDDGGITLTVLSGDPDAVDFRRDEKSATPAHLLVEVRDSGIGISAARLAAIFEPFSAIGPQERRGTGLGLAICRRLVTLMGGHLRVESEVGHGSVFRVCVPLEALATPDGPPSDAPSDANAVVAEGARGVVPESAPETVRAAVARTPAVLLVDDDPHVRETLAALLRRRGFEVDEAETAARALERVDARRYVAVVTDLRMPGMNGVELARILGQRDDTPTLVAMTGGVTGEDVAGIDALFDAVLLKPVTADEVSGALRRCGSASVPPLGTATA